MVKRILSIGILTIFLVTSLVAAYQHHQINTGQKSSVAMSDSRRQYKHEIYYDTYNEELSRFETISLKPEVTVTPSIVPVEEENLTTVKIDIKDSDMKHNGAKDKSPLNINRWDVSLNEDEIDLLAKIVWVESRGESDKGQQAVIEVIFNRMIYEYEFRGSLKDVLSQKNQFSSWKHRNTAQPTDKEYGNINEVLSGNSNLLDFDTVYFSTSPRNKDISEHIGNHWFCRYEYKNGRK